MAKFRRIPVVIDAVQFLPEQGIFLSGIHFSKGRFFVQLNAGTIPIKSGDWVTTDTDGNVVIVNGDAFQTMYEAVTE